MVSSGVVTALNAIEKNYDSSKGASGFSFVTTAIYFGYLNVITSSKKQLDIKNNYMEAFADGQVHMDDSTAKSHSYHSASLGTLREIVDNYKLEQAKLNKFFDEKQKKVAEENLNKQNIKENNRLNELDI